MHNLSMMTFPSAPISCGARSMQTRLAQRAPKVDPSRSESSSQLTDFFKIPKILRVRFRWMTSFTSTGQPFYLGFLFWHLWTIYPPRAHVNTCVQVCTLLTHLLNQKILSLTKPKDKIYKTKSIGHNITLATELKDLWNR